MVTYSFGKLSPWVLALFDAHQLASALEKPPLVNEEQGFRAPSCQINQYLWPQIWSRLCGWVELQTHSEISDLGYFLHADKHLGVGWIIWRDESFLPKHLIFELHYLGGTEESYTLNFSRPGAQIIAQYYNLVHLGFDGFRAIMENCLSNARLLSKSLEATGWYTCVSDIHRKIKDASDEDDETSADYVAGLPVVAFHFSDAFRKDYSHVKQETVSTLLRVKQYIIPNYPYVFSESM